MTHDQLLRAQKIWKDIIETKRRVEVLNNGYVNSVLGWDYTYGDGEKVSFDLDGELREIIIAHLRKELSKLEDEFASI